jgi:NAD(P)-dependent dehydrogenase (short-subunit alcohol dehydrogenase family)
LEDKKILIFGSNSAIPCSIAENLKIKGAKIIFISNEINENEGFIQNIKKDLVHFNYHFIENISGLFSEQLIKYSPFDGIVFAGGIGGVRPIKLNQPSFVMDMFSANVFSFMEIVRQAAKKGFLNDGSSIVALSSVSSVKGLKSKSAYSASKAALEGAVRSFAAELAVRKIRVNVIQKGWVSSDMNLGFIKDNIQLSEEDDFKKQVLGAIEPDEIADLVSFLLSDNVKSITGTSIIIDGGYTL